MPKLFSTAIRAVQNILAPPFCFYCLTYISANQIRVSDRDICSTCAGLIKPILSTKVMVEGYQIPVFALSAYEDPVRVLVNAKRWGRQLESKMLGRLLWDYSLVQQIPFDYVVPLSLHWTRLASRGFNAAELIAHELSYVSGKPVVHALHQIKRTRQQVLCPKTERLRNVEGAFALRPEALMLEGKRILLVDDVMMTGATIFTASRELVKLEFCELSVIVGCRTP